MAKGIAAAALIAAVVVGAGMAAPAFAKHGGGGGHGGGASFSGGLPSGFTTGQRSGRSGSSRELHANLFGRHECLLPLVERQSLRQQFLSLSRVSASLEDVRRVAQAVGKPDGCVGGPKNLDRLPRQRDGLAGSPSVAREHLRPDAAPDGLRPDVVLRSEFLRLSG